MSLGGLHKRFGPAPHDRDAGTEIGQQPGGGLPDPGAATGDQSVPAGQAARREDGQGPQEMSGRSYSGIYPNGRGRESGASVEAG